MTELKEKYKAFVRELEDKIQDKKELEYVKGKFTELFMLFLDEFDKLADEYEDKMQKLLQNQKALADKVEKVEKAVTTLEKDIYAEDAYDFEIICPYCNNNFIIDYNSELKSEVKCPECANTIELDWNEENQEEIGDCQGSCKHCYNDECDMFDEENMEDFEDEDDDM